MDGSGRTESSDPDRAPDERQPTRIQNINRAIILDAALDVFSAHGFRGSTVDQIAARARMSKPNLLYYFRRKQDIYAALLEQTLADWLAPLEALDPAGDPIEQLRGYIARKLDLSAERPAASRLFANEILAGAPVVGTFLQTRLKALVEEKAAVLSAWMNEGRLAPIAPHHLVFAIWATTQHYADFDAQVRAVSGRNLDAADDRRRTAEAVLAILLDGARPRA